jgi:hypothetical protein
LKLVDNRKDGVVNSSEIHWDVPNNDKPGPVGKETWTVLLDRLRGKL